MDAFDLLRMFCALIAVLAMIGLCAMLARKAGLASGAGALGRRRRLHLVETIALDARRRAAILRCDGREHLVILGPASELLIESGLTPVAAEAAPAAPTAPFSLSALRPPPMRRRPTVTADAA